MRRVAECIVLVSAIAVLVSGCGTTTLRVSTEDLLNEFSLQKVDYSDVHLQNGRIFLTGTITLLKAEKFHKEMLFAQEQSRVARIEVFLCSVGGDGQAADQTVRDPLLLARLSQKPDEYLRVRRQSGPGA